MASTARRIDVTSLIDERKLGPFNYKLIVLSWLITVFDGFDMMMISFTAPYMRDELGLDMMMLGNVFSAGLVGMMLGGFFFAYLGDRIGRRKTIIWAAFAFGLGITQDSHPAIAHNGAHIGKVHINLASAVDNVGNTLGSGC